MVNEFNLFGYKEAMQRKNKVLEVCNVKGWELLCMQPGKRYVIKVGMMKYYWTFEEVITNADLKKEVCLNGEANSLDNLSTGGNSLLAGGVSNKVPVVRNSRDF